jgi:hypothetical protein
MSNDLAVGTIKESISAYKQTLRKLCSALANYHLKMFTEAPLLSDEFPAPLLMERSLYRDLALKQTDANLYLTSHRSKQIQSISLKPANFSTSGDTPCSNA